MDGASGLQYSGRVYTNQFAKLSQDICKGVSVSIKQVTDVMPGGISTTTLTVDNTTGRVSASALQSYVENLIGTGKIPGKMASFDEQMTRDKAFYAAVQSEYCFYESRYKVALQHFLQMAANLQGADQKVLQSALNTTIALNQRLNSLLEIINYVGNSRASSVNTRGPEIDAANQELQQRLSVLRSQQEMLTTDAGRIRTQEEMMRYSAEKSRAMNIQIMFFVALNVIALGTVFTVYKAMPSS
jgi:hypothetical protein